MRVLRHRGLSHIHSDSGLAPRATRDLEVGIASGRFAIADPAVAVTALGGSLPALVELRFARPELDGDEAASNLPEMSLRTDLALPRSDRARRPAAGARMVRLLPMRTRPYGVTSRLWTSPRTA